MRIFLTIELFSIVLYVYAQYVDWSARETISNDVWEWHYRISRSIRAYTTNMTFVAFIGVVAGFLFLIWS